MGPAVPAAPLPRRHLQLAEHGQMAQGVPGAGGESFPPRQGFMCPDRRA